MKMTKCALIVGLLAAQVSMAATPAEIAALQNQSEGEVSALQSANQQQIVELKGEVDSLQGQIKILQNTMAHDRNVAVVSFVIAAPLLALAGYGVKDYMGSTGGGNDFGMEIAQGLSRAMIIVGGVPGTIALGTTVYKAYRISIQASEIPELQNRLGKAQDKLDQALQKK